MSASTLLRIAALPLCALLALSAQVAAGSDRTDSTTRTLLIPPTTPLTLRATVGDITVVGWNQPVVRVDVTRRVPAAQPLASITVAIDASDGRALITALQAPGGTSADLAGSITVRAPVDQAFGEIDLFEGRISLNNLRGGVRARVEHGSIDARELGGPIRLESTIGDIRLRTRALSDDGSIRLRTFNGDVALSLASRPLDARILALSLGGSIHSDLPLSLRTSFGPQFGELTLGRGLPVVSIDVVRGDVHVTTGHP